MEAAICMCRARITLAQENALRSGQLEQNAALDAIFQNAVLSRTESSVLQEYPALVNYLQNELNPQPLRARWIGEHGATYKYYACLLPVLHDGGTAVSSAQVLLHVIGIMQTDEDDLQKLALCRLLKTLYVSSLCLCPVISTMFHMFATIASEKVPLDLERAGQALDLSLLLLTQQSPLRPLTAETLSALETMSQSFAIMPDACYDEILGSLNAIWHFGAELAPARKASGACQECILVDARVLFFLQAFFTCAYPEDKASIGTQKCKSRLCSSILTHLIFPEDSSLIHSQEHVTRALMLFREHFVAGELPELTEAIEAHCAAIAELIIPPVNPVEVAEAEAIRDLERRNQLRLQNSLYEPVITDEEVTRIVEIQKFLVSSRSDSNIPKKGFLLAAYRCALTLEKNWQAAIERVQRNPESFQSIMTGPFKNLPLYTTPRRLVELLSERKMRKARGPITEGVTEADSLLDPSTREGVKSATLRLARAQDKVTVTEAHLAEWGTQEEVDAVAEEREQRQLEECAIEKARADNLARQTIKKLPPKQRQKVMKETTAVDSQPAEPAQDAEESTRQFGPDKMKGGRIPKPKAKEPSKRTKTFDKHHARDRRLKKM